MLAILALILGLMAPAGRAQLTLPYEGSVSEAGEAFRVNNTYTGTTRSYGGYFQAAGAEGRGVYGRCTNTVPDVNTYGGFFYAAGPKGRGVFGQSAGGQEGIGVKGWASNAGDVQNFGGHFCATGLQGIGVYGWAENLADTVNYGGYFQADGVFGIGIYAIGGPSGYAGQFEGDIKITGAGKGIVFPDGTKLATAGAGGGGDVDNDWQINGDDMYSIPSGRVGIGVNSFPEPSSSGRLTVDAGVPGYMYAVKASCIGLRIAIKGDSKGDNGTGVEGTAEGNGACGVSGYAKGGASPCGVMGYAEGNNAAGVSGQSSSQGSIGVSGRGQAWDFWAHGPGLDYGSTSSIRWKTDIRSIDDPLEKVLRLRGVYFNWDKEHGGGHDVGMIAEEVGEVLPEIVTYEENGVDSTGLDYGRVTPLLVEAVKALKKDLDDLRHKYAQKDAEVRQLRVEFSRLELLKRENEDLSNRLTALEHAIAFTLSSQKAER
jgi:hypothetical protein